MATEFLHLPQELRIHVLSNLDAVSLTRCATTCESMSETLKASSRLQYIIQLHFDGLEDAGTFTAHSELILRLLHHRQACQALEWRGYDIVDMKGACRKYKLVAGAFANANRQRLEIVWLPTSSNIEGPTLRKTWTGMAIREFAMDPTQDVIAFLEDDTTAPWTNTRTMRIHIRTISTNTRHPLAHQTPLELTVNADPVFGYDLKSALLELAGNTLMLYFCNPSQMWPTVIHIWDWTTSEILLDPSTFFDPLLSHSRYEFGLLDATHCFAISQAHSGSIRLYELVRSPPAAGRAVHRATLHLPPTAPGTQVTSISAHAAPIAATPPPHAPFAPHPDTRLHVFRLAYLHVPRARHGTHVAFNLFVHQHVFTGYCTERASACGGHPPADVPWAEWGPPHTRLVAPACMQLHWLAYTHGQRIVCPLYPRPSQHPAVPGTTTRCVQVLDFARAAVAAAQGISMGGGGGGARGVLVAEGVIRARAVPCFRDDVETRLPFVVTTVEFEREYSGYMIYGDGVVGVTTKEDGSLLLHVYPVLREPFHRANPPGQGDGLLRV